MGDAAASPTTVEQPANCKEMFVTFAQSFGVKTAQIPAPVEAPIMKFVLQTENAALESTALVSASARQVTPRVCVIMSVLVGLPTPAACTANASPTRPVAAMLGTSEPTASLPVPVPLHLFVAATADATILEPVIAQLASVALTARLCALVV